MKRFNDADDSLTKASHKKEDNFIDDVKADSTEDGQYREGDDSVDSDAPSDDNADEDGVDEDEARLGQSESDQRYAMFTEGELDQEGPGETGLGIFKEIFRMTVVAQEDYNQDRMNIQYLLRFPVNKTYELVDLENELFLDRAL